MMKGLKRRRVWEASSEGHVEYGSLERGGARLENNIRSQRP